MLEKTTTAGTIEEKYVDEKGLPMPESGYFSILFRRLDGEWEEYEYPNIKGKVESDGRFKIILNGKGYNLQNIKHWHEGVSREGLMMHYRKKLNEDDFQNLIRSYITHGYSSKELTKILKSNFLYFIEIDSQTVAAMPNEGLIAKEINFNGYGVDFSVDYCNEVLDVIDSKEARNFISLYYLSEEEDPIDDDILLDEMVKVRAVVCHTPLETTIPNRARIEWKKAVELANERFRHYTLAYKDKKKTHQILLMTMVDLATWNYKNCSESDEEENIDLTICDETLSVTINHNEHDLYVKAAEFITDHYNAYQEKYGEVKDTETISCMVLIDVSFNKFEYKKE